MRWIKETWSKHKETIKSVALAVALPLAVVGALNLMEKKEENEEITCLNEPVYKIDDEDNDYVELVANEEEIEA